MSTPQGKMPKSGADPDKNGGSSLSARTTAAKTARRIHKKTDPPVEVPSGRRRASCHFCTKRKRKCNGDGVNRCRYCIELGWLGEVGYLLPDRNKPWSS